MGAAGGASGRRVSWRINAGTDDAANAAADDDADRRRSHPLDMAMDGANSRIPSQGMATRMLRGAAVVVGSAKLALGAVCSRQHLGQLPGERADPGQAVMCHMAQMAFASIEDDLVAAFFPPHALAGPIAL